MTMSVVTAAATLTECLRLAQAPIAVCLTDALPAGVRQFEGRVPAGCRFWQEAAQAVFATAPRDHDLCSLGTYTHNFATTPAHEADRRDALRAFAEAALTGFHKIRRREVEADGNPTVKESLAALQTRG